MRVTIAEDSVLLREGLVRILERFGWEIAGTAGDADELLASVAADQPDLVIADVRMPPAYLDEGLRAAIVLRERHPALGILVLSQYVEQAAARELLEAGVRGIGYLLKDRVGEVSEFVDAARRVADGGTVIDPEVVRQVLTSRRATDPISRMTPREGEVLALMAEGRTNAGIARALVLSEAAVAKHVTGIYLKLDLEPATDDHRRVLAVLARLRAG